jgi:trk system potassium uptake protein TrkH
MNSKTTSPRFPRLLPIRLTSVLRGACVVAGVAALAVFHEVADWSADAMDRFHAAFFWLSMVLSALPLVDWALAFRWPREFQVQGLPLVVVAITMVGAGLLHSGLVQFPGGLSPEEALSVWWQMTIAVWTGMGLLEVFHHVSSAQWNPAFVLVLSFMALISVGTALLMSPFARNASERADFSTALFTATSAVCVTGLVVVDTGTYWSRGGQTLILVLIQLGGLGMMTCGAFFSLIVGGGLQFREMQMMGNLLERQVVSEVRRLLVRIILFTGTIELVGAVCLSGLWADLPLAERVFFSVFHSVSAFCNAGFALQPLSFEGQGHYWQVWGVLAVLIILGGLGFSVLDELWMALQRYGLGKRQRRRRSLQLSSRLALITTLILLAAGMIGYCGLEWRSAAAGAKPLPQFVADAWFQSVTARTAGFNTVPIAALSEPTRLLLMALMFVGASPGSTGGGVKTVAIAVLVLTLRAVMRNRDNAEAFQRSIPQFQVYRAALIVASSAVMLFVMTMALLLTENRHGQFLDFAFETQSALATVGLSTGVTPELSRAGRFVIVLSMFIGRVGPLTMIMALTRVEQPDRFRYPAETVALG